MRISVGNTFIACMLTIIGYSVNDTIVIFDRIRENLALKHGKQTREDLMEVANRSPDTDLITKHQHIHNNIYYGIYAVPSWCSKYS